MEELFLLTMMGLTANKIVSVIKSIFSPDRNTAVTQALVWVVGAVVLFLAAAAEITEALVIPGIKIALGDMDVPSILLTALITGSTGSTIYDFKKAIDSGDTAAEPRLLGPPSP